MFVLFIIFTLFFFSVSQGLDSIYSPDFKPILHNGVSYIVVTVLINERNEVLMMQEAKSSCAGTWYLPAGRVDAGENLVVSTKKKKIIFQCNMKDDL